MAGTYWDGEGKHQAVYEKLNELIPSSGEVSNPRKNKALEKLRAAANCYYDLFNNGLCNRAAQFRQVFGFGGKVIVNNRYNPNLYESRLLEEKLDAIIEAAAKEQNVEL